MGLLMGALAGAGAAVEDTTKYALRTMMDEEKSKRIAEYSGRLKLDQETQTRQKRAGEIRQGVDAEINKRFGDQANALESDDTSAVRKPSRTEALQVRHDVAADLGYDESASEALKARDTETKADYYGARDKNAEDRLAQGNRRLDQQGDRNDAVIDNLDARTEAIAAGKPPKDLTFMQKARNAEIDRAREKVAGLDEASVRVRTQKFSATGRENKDFDPGLARATALAARRKVGDDPWFDSRDGNAGGQSEAAPRADVAELGNRFASDPAMKGKRMGALKPEGREVLDASGKLIGHYR